MASSTLATEQELAAEGLDNETRVSSKGRAGSDLWKRLRSNSQECVAITADLQDHGRPSRKTQRKGGVFADFDKEALKKKLKENKAEERLYNVFDFYYKNGLWSKIAKHDLFEKFTLGVIVLNALWMAWDTNMNNSATLLEADPQFQIMEQFFCVYFSLEWFVRFMSFETREHGVKVMFKDAWFVFDSTLVFMMVGETWVFTILEMLSGQGSPLGGQTQILRLFRLLRLSRLMRMLRSFPELMILIKGMVAAMTSVSYVFLLLCVFLYVFGIAVKQLSSNTEMGETYFPSVLLSMYTLFLYGTFLDDLAALCDAVRAESPVCFVLILFVIFFCSMTVLNMLVGVLCSIVAAVAETEKEEMASMIANERIMHAMKTIDENFDQRISLQEFKQVLVHPEALRALQDVGVDPEILVDFAETFFMKDGVEQQFKFEDFMGLVLELKSSNECKVKDIMNLWRQLSPKMIEVNTTFSGLRKDLRAMSQKFGIMIEQDKKLDKSISIIMEKVAKLE
jgi:voltage-gated sodium channel